MSEVKLLPMLYKQFPSVTNLEKIQDLDFGVDQSLPTIEELQGMGLGKSDNGLMETGVLDSLMTLVKKSEDDYYAVQNPEWTDDIVINKKIQQWIDEYYNVRIRTQATNICDHMDALINLDEYPPEMFGAYKKLHMIIDSTEDKFERARCLNILRITARSIVPPQLKYENVQVLEPSLLSGVRTVEGKL